MYMSGFRLSFERSFKHLLRGNVFATVQFNHAAIVKRVGVTWQHTFGTQPRFSDCHVCTSTSSDFCDLGVTIEQTTKLISCFLKSSPGKFSMGTIKRPQRCRLVDCWLSRRSRSLS